MITLISIKGTNLTNESSRLLPRPLIKIPECNINFLLGDVPIKYSGGMIVVLTYLGNDSDQ